MTDIELSELEAAARAATPGPWEVSRDGDAVFIEAKKGTVAEIVSCGACFDSRYIATVNPQAFLALIKAFRKEREEKLFLQWLVGAIAKSGGEPPSAWGFDRDGRVRES